MYVYHSVLVLTSVLAIALMQHGPTIDGRKTLALMCKLLIIILLTVLPSRKNRLQARTFIENISKLFLGQFASLLKIILSDKNDV